jgi:hypothetical protein
MQISHAEAHKLIQHSMDKPLPQEDKSALASHLQTCLECNRYEAEIKDAETVLRSAMKNRWSLTPAPLDMNAIIGKIGFSPQGRLGMQLAAVGLMIMLVMFETWRFVNINIAPVNTVQIAPIPTPSTQMTNTSTVAPVCSEIIYIVEQGDTLEGIAKLFLTSPEAIMELNNLHSEAIRTGSRIKIPACLTPFMTSHPTTSTVTFSPAPSTALSP